ncbi:MAG: copper amine oxidase N-terminal domain-containing protein [Deltaproteobacteria bacterium]
MTLGVKPAAASEGGQPQIISVVMDGQNIAFSDQGPIMDESTGRIMIPLRSVMESLGAQVSWQSNKAVIKKGETTIILGESSMAPVVNGNVKFLDSPAKLLGGRMMVPARFIGEALGYGVNWDGNTQVVSISTNAVPAPVTEAVSAPMQTAAEIAPKPAQTLSNGLLPDEDKIQKALTQEDIQRLQSYPVIGIAKADLDKQPASERATFTKDFSGFNPGRKASVLNALAILNDISSFDYEAFANPAYTEDFLRKNYCIGERMPANEETIRNFIAKKVSNKLKVKVYLLSSENLIYQASTNYTAIRVKCIFYQTEGALIYREGSTRGKWYYQDMEFLFKAPGGGREGNTTGLVISGTQKLNAPQPYFN